MIDILPISIGVGLTMGALVAGIPQLTGDNIYNLWFLLILFLIATLSTLKAAVLFTSFRSINTVIIVFVVLFQTAAIHTLGPVDANDLFVLMVTMVIIVQSIVADRRLIISTGFLLSLLLLGAIFLSSTHTGPAGLLGIKQILKCILVLFIITNLIIEKHTLQIMIKAVIAMTTLSALIAIAQEILFVSTGFVATMNIGTDSLRYLFEETAFGRMFRVTALNTSYKHFTFFLTSGLLLAFALLIHGNRDDFGSRGRLWFAIGSMFIALILTFSKDAILGFATGLLLILLLSRRINVFHLSVGGIALCLLLIATDLGRDIYEKISSDISGGELRIRLQLARDGIEGIIYQYPLLGVGVNQSIRYTEDFNNWIPHNNLVVTTSEIGLIGLAIYLLVIAYLLFTAFRAWRLSVDHTISSVSLGLLGSSISVLTSLQFHGLYTVSMLWLLLALVEVCADSDRIVDSDIRSDANRG